MEERVKEPTAKKKKKRFSEANTFTIEKFSRTKDKVKEASPEHLKIKLIKTQAREKISNEGHKGLKQKSLM
jgi:hypothetical protein